MLTSVISRSILLQNRIFLLWMDISLQIAPLDLISTSLLGPFQISPTLLRRFPKYLHFSTWIYPSIAMTVNRLPNFNFINFIFSASLFIPHIHFFHNPTLLLFFAVSTLVLSARTTKSSSNIPLEI